MSKNKEKLIQAWEKLSSVYGEKTPKTIKTSLFNIMYYFIVLTDQGIEFPSPEIHDAINDIKLVYDFMDKMETVYAG